MSEIIPEQRDGGYYIGARVKPRVFEQECFFEDVSEETLEKIYCWLRRDTWGDLIFDHRKSPLHFQSGESGINDTQGYLYPVG